MLNKDLKVGDMFTVTEWPFSVDRSFIGDVMEVVVIDYPFVRVFRHTGNIKGFSKKRTLDLNAVNIKKLSQEFIDDVLGDAYTEESEVLNTQIKATSETDE